MAVDLNICWEVLFLESNPFGTHSFHVQCGKEEKSEAKGIVRDQKGSVDRRHLPAL